MLRTFPPLTITDDDDSGCNPSGNKPLVAFLDQAIQRRAFLKGCLAAGVAGAMPRMAVAALPAAGSTLDFAAIPQVITPTHQVAAGYSVQTVLRWGDNIGANQTNTGTEWDVTMQTASTQAQVFGYNNDFLAFLPLAAGQADHGLLWVNHEYTNPDLMFADWSRATQTAEQTAIEMAAHGGSVVEIKRTGNQWQVVPNSRYARRITASTPMQITGPATSHAQMKTAADPTGRRVHGTLNNCAGGVTPWGTVLVAEENFHLYFGTDQDAPHLTDPLYARYGLKAQNRYPWYRHEDRLDLASHPHEPNRFGWIVEVDPFDPAALPRKRTALGRFKHEGATCTTTADGRVVVYCGDDERFEYLYRFVSRDRVSDDRTANADLLDHGTLSVAQFHADGIVRWHPLVYGHGPLTPDNGFASQGDVLIETRRAADLLGATPLDRPEDVEPNPVNGRVYVMLTNNTKRTAAQVDAANPRAHNAHGHVLELIPPAQDHAAEAFQWSVFLLGGPEEQQGASWISSPDNCAFDARGRLWLASDQGSKQKDTGIPDGLFACDVSGDGRAALKFFFACPQGAEMCGPAFTPDGTTLFAAVQHPGEGSTYANPSTRWPDFTPVLPPRPAVVAITKDDGGVIGG